MTRLSAVVTTFNNADTLRSCLESVRWSDEILVLDSFSTDETCQLATEYSAKVIQHEFQGYSKQKQMAIDAAAHDWVLLLDADEALSAESQTEVQKLLEAGPSADGYTLPRIEQLFWQMTHPGSRMNHFLRLFDRRHCSMNDVPVHAAPVRRSGRIELLDEGFYHFGEPDIHTKVDKLNSYSTGLVEYKADRKKKASMLTCIVYPPLMFLKSFVFKRNYRNGWAGFIGSVCMAFYAFLKYAKLYEHFRHAKIDLAMMPEEHPEKLARRLKLEDAKAVAESPERRAA